MEFEVRDPIHNRIAFDAFERRIIDHPFVQRLRFINQLSFLNYVYPGGVHDRFNHCLGAMHVAGRLFDHLFRPQGLLCSRFSTAEVDKLRRRVRLAGLLHDLGHGPFSHASESVFPSIGDLPLNWHWWTHLPDRQARHEDYSVLLIQTLAQENVLESSLAQDIASLIHPDLQPSDDFKALQANAPGLQVILHGLISGEIDCDRMDYLLRDSHYCGVYYGHFDFNWLIGSLDVAEHQGGLVITLTENGVRAYEDMLLARYHMIDQVYFHKTAMGFSHYLQQAIKNQEIDLVVPSDPHEYADMHDGRVIEKLWQAAKQPDNYWSSHLMNRWPAKRILRLNRSNPSDLEILEQLTDDCQSRGVRYFTHTAAQQLSHLGEGQNAHESMYVAKKTLSGCQFIPIFEYSDLLQKYNEKIHFTDFFVLREDFDKFKRN
ncbi:HD domain-containing protein [Patescibacteria group bacterium]|nr:HD domain-containing protein [Patescibacteria group bacterium]MBU1705631.1 HD domain-containing protein [Patescibacteria group bacterium]